MLDFSNFLDLPLVWGGILSFTIFLYVLLDGFDLGVGILFPFAPSEDCRNKMMNSIAPFWDGNETWLVLGGGGLFAAFPLAYSVILSALYLPIILMLLGLVFRGVAFEFRFKAQGKKRIYWDFSFHFGSLAATFFQGALLGAFIQGIQMEGRKFSGGSFDWVTPFSMMTGAALVFGYSLLGSTWLVMKTDKETQAWARKTAVYALLYVSFFIGLVSLWVPFLEGAIASRWFSVPNIFYLAPVPLLTLIIMGSLFYDLIFKKYEIKPFVLSIMLFLFCFIGLAISLWPWIIPYKVSLWEAAANPKSQSLELLGVAILMPIILGYTCYSYYVFRGKSSAAEY